MYSMFIHSEASLCARGRSRLRWTTYMRCRCLCDCLLSILVARLSVLVQQLVSELGRRGKGKNLKCCGRLRILRGAGTILAACIAELVAKAIFRARNCCVSSTFGGVMIEIENLWVFWRIWARIFNLSRSGAGRAPKRIFYLGIVKFRWPWVSTSILFPKSGGNWMCK